ncbi:DUF1589 domain-containing protein [Rhodopirellula baltica]
MPSLQFAFLPRRPCCTWQPSRCFGTKRGVIRMPSQAQHSPARNHRQVEPGLRLWPFPTSPNHEKNPTRCAGFFHSNCWE